MFNLRSEAAILTDNRSNNTMSIVPIQCQKTHKRNKKQYFLLFAFWYKCIYFKVSSNPKNWCIHIWRFFINASNIHPQIYLILLNVVSFYNLCNIVSRSMFKNVELAFFEGKLGRFLIITSLIWSFSNLLHLHGKWKWKYIQLRWELFLVYN